LYIGAAALLSGCFEKANTQALPNTRATEVRAYTGPAPATADVAAFMNTLWSNIKGNNRCGSCHGAGGQTPAFARDDDVNLAYAEAIKLVDLTTPADSRLVAKVSGGHNCWLDNDAACGAILTSSIESWIGGAASTSSKQITLTAPVIKEPGASKAFPADAALFTATVYPLLEDYCQRCHAESSATPQQPFFASADVNVAYDAVTTSRKIDLDRPENSRLVLRLRDEFHNCWDDCAANANAMQQAIEDFSGDILTAQVAPELVASKALSLPDGVVAAGGSRFEGNLIALWEFKEGSGTTLYDTSGVEPALHLTLSGTAGTDFNWVGGWGVEFITAKAQGSTASSKKLYDFISASGEYSIEAWVVPANVTQEGPARIVSYSAGMQARNFTLGQTQYTYNFLQRSTATGANGDPALSTADADEDLQATQQHVVLTYDPVNGRRIYVNGVFTDDADPLDPGTLAPWDNSFAFILGNEVGGGRQWQGKLRLVAIHNRALTEAQIQQNYAVGVGEKFYLLFSISDLIDVPQSYILFEVSQFDSYSYLFNQPKFITLDAAARPDNIRMRGMRIGLNGKEPAVGQAYTHLDTTLNSSDYTAEGIVLSNMGTVIASEQGPESDEFFLTFEILGDHSNVYTEPTPLATAAADSQPAADIGLRTFDEVNATMARITGVSRNESNVKTTYDTIKQQLPTVENIEGFLASHQVAISQLAIEYCNALVEDSALRSAFFPGVDFNAAAATAFDTPGERALIAEPLLDNVMGSNLATQPADNAVQAELDDLIVGLSSCSGGCAADRTKTIAKAACAATLGSAVMLVQ
jgi:hypothetical protein